MSVSELIAISLEISNIGGPACLNILQVLCGAKKLVVLRMVSINQGNGIRRGAMNPFNKVCIVRNDDAFFNQKGVIRDKVVLGGYTDCRRHITELWNISKRWERVY